MKNCFKYSLLLLLLVNVLSSCEQKVPLYSDEYNRIAIDYQISWQNTDSTANYSFALYTEEVQQDTVFIPITLVGFTSDKDRPIQLRQHIVTEADLEEGETVVNAESGVHYVAFDDESVSSNYCIKADSLGATLPIILKRDPSLKTGTHTLWVEIVENDQFKISDANATIKKIIFSDQLMKPARWTGTAGWYLGAYGTEKHKLMIEVLEPYGILADDEFMEVCNDYSMAMYWIGKFKKRLAEINIELGEPLTESEEYGKVPVAFTL